VGFNGYHSNLGFVYTTVNKMKELGETRQTIKLVGKNGTVSPHLFKIAQKSRSRKVFVCDFEEFAGVP
jgi:hypothetical protein